MERSRALFNEGHIRDDIVLNDGDLGEDELRKRVAAAILHKATLRRIKLGFACLLTSVGIPMILAGDEFGDQHDLFDSHGLVTQEGGKQVDPVNFSRAEEPDRKELFEYVAGLVKLRKSHPALSVNETEFIQVDLEQGKQVVAWKRGTNDPVVVVANFSDFTTPNALSPQAEYFVPNWPPTPAGMQWFEATQKRNVTTGRHNREPIFAWEAKVYQLVPVSD